MFEINNIINYNNDHARIFLLSNFSIINETKKKIQKKFNSKKIIIFKLNNLG
jgi:hypothetical protein